MGMWGQSGGYHDCWENTVLPAALHRSGSKRLSSFSVQNHSASAMRKEARSLLYLAVLMALFLAQPVPASGQTPQSTILASMDHPGSLNLSEGSP